MATKKEELIVHLERIVGNKFYNGKIKNWGANGSCYLDGREYRYPITFIKDSKEIKRRHVSIEDATNLPFETGHYSCGANKLFIIEALDEVIDFLEKEYELNIQHSK